MFEKNIAPEYRVYIRDLPKEQVLAALYNRASPQGMGILMYKPDIMDAEKAFFVINFRGDDAFYSARGMSFKSDLRNEFYFDYLFGRALKVDISGDVFSSKMYDEYNGDKAAEQVIEKLRESVFSDLRVKV